jgi:hypothetical protein
MQHVPQVLKAFRAQRLERTRFRHQILLQTEEKCYGNSVLFQVQQWCSLVEDAECLGHLVRNKTDENVDQVKERVLKDRRITTCEGGNTSAN